MVQQSKCGAMPSAAEKLAFLPARSRHRVCVRVDCDSLYVSGDALLHIGALTCPDMAVRLLTPEALLLRLGALPKAEHSPAREARATVAATRVLAIPMMMPNKHRQEPELTNESLMYGNRQLRNINQTD